MPAPEITEKNGGVSTTLFPNLHLNDDGEKRGEKLSTNRLRILNAMREYRSISQVMLVQKVGIGSTSIEKNIHSLKDQGYIKRIGPAKGDHWEITVD